MKNICLILLITSLCACGQNRKPQEPKSPLPYISEEVKFENKTHEAILAGTLTYPESGNKFPAAILVSGSGLQDRNETVYGHKPFLVLADYLTRNGIAVLRYDERSIGGSTGKIRNATSETFASDTYAGIKYLKTRQLIDTNKIGIIGHSEGGMIGAMLASQHPEIAFFVSLAGPGLPFDQVLITANESKLRGEGKSEEIVQAGSKLLELLFEEIRKGAGYSTTKRELTRIIKEWRNSLTGEAKTDIEEFMAGNKGHFEYVADEWASPWFEYIVNHDPRNSFRKIKCPVLVLNGKKDIQVLAENNLPEIEKALLEGDNTNYRVEYLEDINHLFQKCKTGFRDEYASLNETFNEEVMKLIGEWINEHTK